MPPRREKPDTKPPTPEEGPGTAKTRIRIGRACDRCKIKKSKCDGSNPCSACVANDVNCEYSTRRRREARDWYWSMNDVIDEALQRLYWACREGRGFPGVLPDESGGRVSTEAILQGLGLTPPSLDRMNLQNEDGSDAGEPSIERTFHPPDLKRDDVSRIAMPLNPGEPHSQVSGEGAEVANPHGQRAGTRTRGPKEDQGLVEVQPGIAQHVSSPIESATDSMMNQTSNNPSFMGMHNPGYAGVNPAFLGSSGGPDVFPQNREFRYGYPPNTAQNMPGPAPLPDGQQGWGGQSTNSDAEMLHWTGSMSAMYQDPTQSGPRQNFMPGSGWDQSQQGPPG